MKIKTVTRDKGHYIVIKESIQKDITIVNKYAPGIRASEYIRQMLIDIKVEIGNSTIIIGDINSPLKPLDRSSRQKINKDTN